MLILVQSVDYPLFSLFNNIYINSIKLYIYYFKNNNKFNNLKNCYHLSV